MRPGDERAGALRLQTWELGIGGEHEVMMGRGDWAAVLDQQVAVRSSGAPSKLFLFLAGDRIVRTTPATTWWARRLVAGGTQLRPFTNEVLDACLKATNELWAEISAKNADFKKAIDAMQAYRSDQYLWWQVAEYTNDSFMIRSRTRG